MTVLCSHHSLVALFTLTGAVFSFLVDIIFTFHYFVGSDGWPDDVKRAFDCYNVVWIVGSIVAFAMLIALCVDHYCSRLLAVALILSGVSNLAAAWDYIYESNLHSDLKAPARTWVLTSIACICWVAAGILRLLSPGPYEEEAEVACYSHLSSLDEEGVDIESEDNGRD